MEMRKVQVTGGSTYIVSLPKKWVKEVGLAPNDTVGIVVQADGTLVLTPRLSSGEEPRSKLFRLDDEPHDEELLRNLIGAYVTGYDIIEVHQEPRMSRDQSARTESAGSLTMAMLLALRAPRSAPIRRFSLS